MPVDKGKWRDLLQRKISVAKKEEIGEERAEGKKTRGWERWRGEKRAKDTLIGENSILNGKEVCFDKTFVIPKNLKIKM